MNRATLRIFAAVGSLLAASAFAQVDYTKKAQRNPTGDPAIEKGYQDTKKQIEDRRAEPPKTPRESTGTTKQEGTYGKDWQEEQLGTKGKTRTW